MKVGKPKSKRVPVRLRHKIEKASAAKQRKQRKEAKKNPQWRSRLKKDPGIPNLFPFKDKVLAEIEESRRRKEEEAQQRRELAKARREGIAVEVDGSELQAAKRTRHNADNDDQNDDDDDLVDADDVDADDSDAMDEDAANPMAALLASAQARAQQFGGSRKAGNEDEAEEDADDDDGDSADWVAQSDSRPGGPGNAAGAAKQPAGAPARKTLPKQALDDPVKAVSRLLDRLQRTQTGVQALLDHYQLPPLVTAGSDAATRFLVEVARKRGRLGKGGVPNLPAAALVVLGDLMDERLLLPSPPAEKTAVSSTGAGEVKIVSRMAEPFRIEGLFGDGVPQA